MKMCSKCKRMLPETEFHRNKNTHDGLRYECKDCQKAYEQERQRQLRAVHRCIRCGKGEATGDHVLCAACREKTREKSILYRGNKKEASHAD